MRIEELGRGVGREGFRGSLLVLGVVVTAFGLGHHVDHVIRGNHSGWPFQEAVTPFTFSLLVYALLLPGIFVNLRGRVAAGWWLFTAAVALALVSFVHFLSGEDREAPMRDIYAVYDSPAAGLAALFILTGLLTSLLALLVTAIAALRARNTRKEEKMSKLARFLNLVLAGLLAGNELGTKVAVHPALEELSTTERVRAEQAVTRRYAAIMPFWMSSTIASCVAVLALSRGRSGFVPTLFGALCFVGMLISTLLGNVPINNRMPEIDPEKDQQEFVELRERWDRLHTLRVALNVAGLAFLVGGALSDAED